MVLLLDFLCSVTIIRWFLIFCWMQDPHQNNSMRRKLITGDCVFTHKLKNRKPFVITNEGYPDPYDKSTQCLYVIRSHSNTKISMLCKRFDIPESDECQEDAVMISKSGDQEFADGYTLCGTHRFLYAVSDSNKLTMNIMATTDSDGGVFKCLFRMIEPDTKEYCQCGTVNESPDMQDEGPVKSEATEPGQYPCMAALLDTTKNKVFGGATIISKKFALTTANALTYQSNHRNVLLVTGVHDFIGFDSSQQPDNTYTLQKYYIHRQYDILTMENNIALVKTSEEIRFDEKVGPACLPIHLRHFSYNGIHVIALGWKKIKKRPLKSDPLQHVTLKVVSHAVCKKYFRVTKQDMCARPLAYSKLGCNYYPGGPIFLKDLGRLYLLGLQTFLKCETKAVTKHTSVSTHLLWIRKVTRGDVYCEQSKYMEY